MRVMRMEGELCQLTFDVGRVLICAWLVPLLNLVDVFGSLSMGVLVFRFALCCPYFSVAPAVINKRQCNDHSCLTVGN